MDKLVEKLKECAERLRAAKATFYKNRANAVADRILAAAGELDAAWSGSWIGYQALVYTKGFRPRRPGEFFDSEWGLGSPNGQTFGDWVIYSRDGIREWVAGRAGCEDLQPTDAAGEKATKVFDAAKAEVLPIIQALVEQEASPALTERLQHVRKLNPYTSASNFMAVQHPKQFQSRDRMAMQQGLCYPPHREVQAWLVENQTRADNCEVLAEHVEFVVNLIKAKKLMRSSTAKVPFSTKVFVVHGHDHGTKDSVARLLEKLGLEAVILHEQPGKGRTIIEKFENYADVGFAVVILSADDLGKAKADGDLRPRARQNVILELGYFIGRLGRDRVCALKDEGVEAPSDFAGVEYVSADKGAAWRFTLARELQAASYNVDMNKVRH